MNEPPLISFPARPVNGGRLEHAPPKVGPWVVQPKIDDWRGALHVPTGRVWNRFGEPMTKDVTDKIQDAIKQIQPFAKDYEWLDIGVMERRHDMMRGTIIVFDWIIPDLTQQQRRDQLWMAFDEMLLAANMLANGPLRDRVFLIQEFVSTSADKIYKTFQSENSGLKTLTGSEHNFYEGIVCKRTDKPYPVQLLSPNKETPWMIKHRFDQ